MKNPRITEAKAITDRIGADAVVILAFKDGRIAGASYGKTKLQCAMIGKWLDGLIDGMAAGYVPTPDGPI